MWASRLPCIYIFSASYYWAGVLYSRLLPCSWTNGYGTRALLPLLWDKWVQFSCPVVLFWGQGVWYSRPFVLLLGQRVWYSRTSDSWTLLEIQHVRPLSAAERRIVVGGGWQSSTGLSLTYAANLQVSYHTSTVDDGFIGERLL